MMHDTIIFLNADFEFLCILPTFFSMKDSDEIQLIAKEESIVEASDSTLTLKGGFEEASFSVSGDAALLLERPMMETVPGF